MGPYEIRIDTAFDAVIEELRGVPKPGRVDTWINHPIQRLYGQLYAREAWPIASRPGWRR